MIPSTAPTPEADQHRRVNVTFPTDLLRSLDEVVSPRGRNRFIVEATARALRRDRLARVIASLRHAPAWSEDEHPALRGDEDIAHYVEDLRRQWPGRSWDEIEAQQDG